VKEPLRQQLEFGLQQMGLYFPVPVQQKLVHYIQLIARWNKTFNLTAIRDVEEMVSKHLLDSLAVQPYVEGKTVLDVGSGAGLPGIPFAITSPDKHFVLLDSNGKKTRFLTQAKIDLKLENVEVVHQRVQDYCPARKGHRIYFDVITARAYAATDEILRSTAHLQDENTHILVMQGKRDEQIDTDKYRLLETHALDVYGLDAERHLLEIQKLQA
jgi:16S rRNA (guanine527-N7)-methyltransferase